MNVSSLSRRKSLPLDGVRVLVVFAVAYAAVGMPWFAWRETAKG